ncbi:MAG: DUF4268 domain-containing protein [Oscillospiraceae bacterium]|nr:DUF4268 domain-containing protein [Oscillospiraceae bacterium]
MSNLGKIEKINDLRLIWKHEAKDFSKWLSQEENLALLSDTIGVDIVLEENESSVGNFSVDIFATEEGSGRKIIIENQLEDTNHDHLGKIITYASGKGAEVIIWIVKHARDEHRQAVEWLNQHTDENIGFFLLEIELWKINDSLPAPMFKIVEQPNNWTKTIKSVQGLSNTKLLQLNFWQAFSDYVFEKKEFADKFSKRKAQPQHWYSVSLGRPSYSLSFFVNTQKNKIGVEIYVSGNKDLYRHFLDQKDVIEQELNMTLEWKEASKDCAIRARVNGDIKKDERYWNGYFDWFCKTALKFKEVFAKYEN